MSSPQPPYLAVIASIPVRRPGDPDATRLAQDFLDFWSGQSSRRGYRSELILIEAQEYEGEPELANHLVEPADSLACEIQIITASLKSRMGRRGLAGAALHNLGIRAATASFVLVAQPGFEVPGELLDQIETRSLYEDVPYWASLPRTSPGVEDGSSDCPESLHSEAEAFFGRRIDRLLIQRCWLRLQARRGEAGSVECQDLLNEAYGELCPIPERYLSAAPSPLLISRHAWNAMRGIPELPLDANSLGILTLSLAVRVCRKDILLRSDSIGAGTGSSGTHEAPPSREIEPSTPGQLRRLIFEMFRRGKNIWNTPEWGGSDLSFAHRKLFHREQPNVFLDELPLSEEPSPASRCTRLERYFLQGARVVARRTPAVFEIAPNAESKGILFPLERRPTGDLLGNWLFAEISGIVRSGSIETGVLALDAPPREFQGHVANTSANPFNFRFLLSSEGPARTGILIRNLDPRRPAVVEVHAVRQSHLHFDPETQSTPEFAGPVPFVAQWSAVYGTFETASPRLILRDRHFHSMKEPWIFRWIRGIRLIIHPGSALDRAIYTSGHYEPGILVSLEQRLREGDSVLDLGMDSCAASLFAARLIGESGRLRICEPDESRQEVLRRHLALNDLPQCELLDLPLDEATRNHELRRLARSSKWILLPHDSESILKCLPELLAPPFAGEAMILGRGTPPGNSERLLAWVRQTRRRTYAFDERTARFRKVPEDIPPSQLDTPCWFTTGGR